MSIYHFQAYPESRTLLGHSGAIVQRKSDFRTPRSKSIPVSTPVRPHYRSAVAAPFSLQSLDDLESLCKLNMSYIFILGLFYDPLSEVTNHWAVSFHQCPHRSSGRPPQ